MVSLPPGIVSVIISLPEIVSLPVIVSAMVSEIVSLIVSLLPPVFSACNVNGKRAYELARKDKEVELHAKQVRVDEIELLDFNDELKQARIRVVCGKGTYIRSLARDIGEALGSGAYLTALCRTRLGDVRIEDCHTIDNFQEWLDAQEVAPYIECVQNPPGTGKAKKKKWHGHSKSKNNSN